MVQDNELQPESIDWEKGKLKLSKVGEIPLENIAKLQKELARKVKGSNNWHKCRERLAKAYQKLVSQRDDFLHKLSRYYLDNYDLIAVEDLNVSGMSRGKLA